MDCNESRALLPLSVDRELDLPGEDALAAHLASCPDCTKQRQRLVDAATALRSAASYHRAPAALRARIEAALPAATTAADARLAPLPAHAAPAGRFVWRLLNGAGLAAAACAALALVLVWPREQANDQRLTDEIVASHARALLTNHVIDIASSDQHTVKPWFSARLDFSPPVRDFSAQGFPLVGGRLDYLDRHPVAVLVYRHRLHQIEVFVWPSDGAAAAATTKSTPGYHIVGRTAAGLAFVALSDVDAGELQRLVDLIQD